MFENLYMSGIMLAIVGGIASVAAFILHAQFGFDRIAVDIFMTAMFTGLGLGALGALFA